MAEVTICPELDFFADTKYRRTLNPDELKPKNKSKFRHKQFIGWDGEGITDDTGRHHYVLFGNSRGDRVRATPSWDGTYRNGISSSKAFEALIRSASDNPKAIHVVYYGSYDSNMLLRGFPRGALERINEGKKTYFEQYSVDVRFGKRLWVKDRELDKSVTLWDVGSFFQQSFVKSLRTWGVSLPEGMLEFIEQQKLNRSKFTAEDMPEIDRYMTAELDSLVLLMEDFTDALMEAGITISQWHGPGAIAGALYKSHGIKQHKAITDDNINRAAQYAYGGGRIEPTRKGHLNGRCYYYDVRSCYPAAIARLPSLTDASWLVSSNPEPEAKPFSLYRVSWDFPSGERFYPTRHRYVDGSVCYPQTGIGTWLWTPEYELLRDFYPGCFTVEESYLFTSPYIYPFEWVEEMYYQRQQWKQEGRGAERILKLGLNSLYGKMIQQLGWRPLETFEDVKDGAPVAKLPAWHQLEWGGYVTSSARAQLFRAARTNSLGVIGFETDGVITTSPLLVSESDRLGDWEAESYEGITYVQSGFYWLDKPNGKVKVKYRGFDAGSVDRNRLLDAWSNHDPIYRAKLTRHMGLAYCLHTNHMRDWGNWITADRELDIAGASPKRIHVCEPGSCAMHGQSFADGLHDTMPYGYGMEFSAPYPLEWRSEVPEWKQDLMAFDMEATDFDSWRWA